MCGIFCSVSDGDADQENQYSNTFFDVLSNRGPDLNGKISLKLSDVNRTLLFAGHVLWQQGERPERQPAETPRGVLLFNGDIFGGEIKTTNGNDTLLLSESLESSTSVTNTLRNITGPYCIIYFDKLENKLYFGRDPVGRHSLLCTRMSDQFIISSVAKNNLSSTAEVPALGIFCLDLNDNEMYLDPWDSIDTPAAETLLKDFENTICYKINIRQKIIDSKISQTHEIPHFNFDTCIKNLANIENLYSELINIKEIEQTVDKLLHLLEESVRVRVQTTPAKCKNCIKKYDARDCSHCRVGVLFSGGLDCSILALLANKFLPDNVPIDLLNVAFEKVKKDTTNVKQQKRQPSDNSGDAEDPDGMWNVPDRLTGLATYEELKRLCPNRVWNFVSVNVSREELESELARRICHLVHPLRSVLDESIGAAVWFASRARGQIYTTDTNSGESYTSPCRVMLMGMGADEIFGGYTRHRAAYRRDGWTGLAAVLDADLRRIPYRNLGRDNRVTSDNGVQARTPYLDENVLEFANDLKAYQRCYLDLPCGVGDKLLLRLLAAQRLGLRGAAGLPKRALQFGSRIADRRQNGADDSKYLAA